MLRVMIVGPEGREDRLQNCLKLMQGKVKRSLLMTRKDYHKQGWGFGERIHCCWCNEGRRRALLIVVGRG